MPSIFARIASGDIPSVKLYADDLTYAFMDVNPGARGHALVVPREEYADIFAMPPELLAAVAHTTQRVAQAIKAALAPDGINIIQNNGAAAGQTVFHFHVHLIPRWQGDEALGLWTPHPSDPATLEALAADIRQHVR